MTDLWRLDTLPSEILIIIFDYCHAFDLVRLSEVCTRFNDVIHDKILWVKKSKKTLVTNQASKRFRGRSVRLCSLFITFYVSDFKLTIYLRKFHQTRFKTLTYKMENNLKG